MIRYLGHPSERDYAIATLQDQNGSDPLDPPILLKLNMSNNYYQYDYSGKVYKNSVDEKELEEKVRMTIPFACESM